MTKVTYRIYYLLAGAWRRRYLIILPILLLPILGLVVGFISPKNYKAHTSMLIQEAAKLNPFLEDLAVETQMKERIGALETLLHSRHILGAVAEELGMVDDKTPPKQFDETIGQLSTGLVMSMAGKDLIRIDYQSRHPERMKEILESVSKHFVEQLLAPELSSMKDSAYFLSEHLKHRREELDQAETSLAEYKNTHASELPELHTANVSRLAQMRQRLAEREAEMAGASKSLGGLDEQLSKTNPVVGKLEEQIVAIRSELALLRARYTDDHSSVQGALRKLRRLEEERERLLQQNERPVDADKLWQIASTAQENPDGKMQSQPLLVSQLQNLQQERSKVDSLAEEIKTLKGMIADLEQKTSVSGSEEQTLGKLERDLKVKRNLYEELLRRYEMARVTGSLGAFQQNKSVKVIDQPYTPTAPSNLPVILFAIGGLFGGLFLGSGMALVLELSDTSIRRREQLEALTGAPVLSRIPPLAPFIGATP